MSSLTHLPLEPGCEDYSILDQAVADLERGLDSILNDSLETPGLDASLDEPDAITSSVSCWFLCFISTLSDNPKLQLAPSITSHKLWCQVTALLAPVSLATKMLASQLIHIHYFSSHPAAFGFQSFTPPDNITLTSVNRKADQNLSDLQTGVGAAAYATLDTEQLMSCLGVALVDTLSSLPDSEDGIILVSEVCNLLLKVHDILDNAVSKWVGNSAHILAHDHMILILFPGSVMRSGLHTYLFFTVSRMWFLLVRLASMAAVTSLLHRLSNSLSWVCLSLFHLRGVARPGQQLGSISQCTRDLCQVYWYIFG